MRSEPGRVAMVALGGTVVLLTAVVGPAAADEQPDTDSRVETDDQGRGHAYAYGQTARPADGGGLARGHLKDRGADRQTGPRAKGDVDHAHGAGHAVGHQHGDGLVPGHVHGKGTGLAKGLANAADAPATDGADAVED